MITRGKLSELLVLAAQFNLKKLQTPELTLEFWPKVGEVYPPSVPVPADEIMPPDDEMLLYATESFDALRAQRKGEA